METIEQTQLAAELQELYLENKEWLSEVLFMEDEIRFLKKLFDKIITSAIHEKKIEELQPLNQNLAALDLKRTTIKEAIVKNQHQLEELIKNPEKRVELTVIETNEQIVKSIKALFADLKLIKRNLYHLAEELFVEENKNHLLAP